MKPLQGVLSVLGRLMLCVVFFMSAVGNKIPKFDAVVGYMQAAGIPAPSIMLVGAIAFLIAGSVLVVLGFQARIGATLLLIFLVLATYYFHAFWKLEGPAQAGEMINFMKNLALAGAMVFIIANGSGKASLDATLNKSSS